MKKLLIGMAAISTLAIAAPAAAQYQDYNAYGAGNLSARIDQLQARIQMGVQSGAITRQEAPALRQQLRQLRDLERRYSVGGFSGQERGDLQQRIRDLRQRIRYAEGGAQGRDRNDDNRCYVTQDWIDQNRDGYDDRDTDRDGRWDDNVDCGDRDDEWNDNDDWRNGRNSGDWVDQNRDGYDDRDYDRDGRWDDDRYEQPRRGGIGGVIDNIFGTGGLRVGQRVTSGLYALPYEYRNQYRDGNGAYYRTDGRQIYQIDARTNTVVRVYGMNR